MIEVSGLTRRYGTRVAVADVSFSVASGQVLALVGDSGSGKTTTLMMLAGFESPTSGDILLGGKQITGTPPHKRNFGMVFQNYALFPHLTVGENVAYPLTVRKVPKAEQAERVKKALDMVRLSAWPTGCPPACRAASSSAWPWPAPWSSTPSWC